MHEHLLGENIVSGFIQFRIDSAAAFRFVAWKERIFGRIVFLTKSNVHIHIQGIHVKQAKREKQNEIRKSRR